ncbi:META domain-containing protein [Taibaiella koreensis]|uniref:META domain-containing protein n=1 Tax=Taibaiella koreensis TaxID=1268548 RepID=UPI000E59A5F8|nr:META domain-containing protein [Taibaiella koreensis]
MKKLSGIIACCISLSACMAGRPSLVKGTAGPPASARWVLQSLEDTALQRQWRGVATLVLGRDSAASGHMICNTFNGHYTIDTAERSLQFNHLAATWKACSGSKAEAAYMNMLRSIDHYELTAQRLIVYSGGKKLAVYDLSKGN